MTPEIVPTIQVLSNSPHQPVVESSRSLSSSSSAEVMAQQGGRIELSLEYLIRLKSITHPEKFLRDYGYIRDKLTPEQIDRKRRCKNCHKSKSPSYLPALSLILGVVIGGKPEQPKEGTTPKFPKSNPKIPVASSAKAPLPGKQSSSGLLQGTTDPAQAEGKKESEPKLRCKFHKGELTYQRSGPRVGCPP